MNSFNIDERINNIIKTLERLLENKAKEDEIFKIITSEKDPIARFDAIISYFQSKVSWKEKILLPLSKHLFIVCKDGKPIVKSECGYEFGDYRINWKVFSKVRVRRTRKDLLELYPYFMHGDPDWIEIREYICPKCGKLLDVEAVPPGYPPLFEYLPDLVTFYEKWLKRDFPCGRVEFKDLTNDYIKNHIKV
ncbi:MAG: acetone carboxylase subunit gamma [Caldisphaera sp.]|nr:MAG: acetone carboxylase subunit gamma [Caldisphaera sp.]